MSTFSNFWKTSMHGFEKAKLTKTEIAQVREKIEQLQSKGTSSSKIITALQKLNPKLSERWKAERAFWTETKREDTGIVGEAGEYIGFEEYRVILSPHPCKLCIDKTNNGSKIFSQKDIEKTGYGQFVPWHPNCYCVAVPYVS